MILYKKTQNSFRSWLRRFVAIFFIALLVVGWGMWQVTRANKLGSELVSFSINPGQGVKQIAVTLEEVGLITTRWWFETWVYVVGTEKKFIAGDYKLPGNLSILNLNRLLTGGLSPESEAVVTIIEGWTIEDINQYLESNDLYNEDAFVKIVINPELFNPIAESVGLSLQSKPASASLEGYLFPDTYRVFKNSNPEALVSKMLANFAAKFKPEWRASLEARDYNVWQAVILASIVEKEVPSLADRKIVADIFWRRIEAGQGLQADSTVNYITGKKTPSASLDDTKIDSPYNTYKYRGLPPGPISNPGVTALEAVANPTPNNYWFFLTTPEGEVIYSRTFTEHVSAKQKYLY